ncbi:hypothetical protein, partial [Hephaestia caeni]|uniref:hypothetical protein n=1 Tax=Hephaestia caeni TaxID=645617 RepID=UPI001B87BA2E
LGQPSPLLHLRSCATTMVGLWLPLDESRGSRQFAQNYDCYARWAGLAELPAWLNAMSRFVV